MYLIKGYRDYYNERGEYLMSEIHRSTLAEAIEASQCFERCLVLNLNKPRGAYGYDISYSRGF